MFTVTCTSVRLSDGRYRLIEAAPKGGSAQETVLKRELSPVWDLVLTYAEASREEQRQWMLGIERHSRSRLIAFLAALENFGLVALGRSANTIVRGIPKQLDKVHMELTYRCNFECVACYLGDKLETASGPSRARELSTAEWAGIIGQAAELGCMSAVITGGEPFVREDIMAILEALDSHAILININTNASPISSKMAAMLSELMVACVSVTLYGHDRASAQEYSGNGAGYDAALTGIKRLVQAGVPVLVKYFATRYNAGGFEKVTDELRPLGVTPIRIGHSIHRDIFKGQFRQSASAVSDTNIHTTSTVQNTQLPCHPMDNEVSIEPDGTIRACPKISVHFGNAYRDGLGAVFQKSDTAQQFRQFWVEYCNEEGFVQGAERRITCPAAEMLMKPTGLSSFQGRWQRFKEEDNVRAHS